MNSRELVYKTLEFKSPDRVPRQLWVLPWAIMNYKDMYDKINEDYAPDIVNAWAKCQQYATTSGDPCKIGNYTDEWGCTFENKVEGIIGEVKKPLVIDENWEDFHKVHIPTEQLTFDVNEVNEFCANTDKFVLSGACPRPFEQMQFIRGTEELYVDLALDNEGMLKSLSKIHEFYCELLTKWAETDVDGLSIMDDWGAQKSLLINPKKWVEIFKPMYKDYVDIAHKHGKKIFMHSDGYTMDIIPHLIEIGLDAFNTQIFCMGVENLKQFAGKITFWGEIDRQWILPYATTEEVVEAVEKVHNNLWKNGGVIAECEFGIGANPHNVYTVFQTWDNLVK